ncbi:hypothetical protein Ahy_Scaffold5g107744 isoform A [Arachis hypogaea]|uniref:CCHC-type domain-containing protein n=1 Tax=Arachis hypogaea TaxID=3818 RepID=A0A444WQ43_ARAHY|nr:hypothetical protein Ahy_Scaffold5g107744 isoform A [Arachis hypogaea]
MDFKAGCRPLIGLNGCHLKGYYGGQLLPARNKAKVGSRFYNFFNRTLIISQQKNKILSLINRRLVCILEGKPVLVIYGIPCVHALEAIQKRCDKPESYVHPWLKIDTFRATYEHIIKLVNLEKYWVKTGLLSPKPPTIRRPIGCSTKKVNPVENTHDRTKGRRTSNVTCQKCSEAGHNAKTCKGQPRPKPHQRIRIIKRVMKVDPPLHQGHRKKYKPHLAPVTIPTPHVTLVLAPRPSPPPTLTLAPTVSFAPVPRSLHPNHIPRVSSEIIAATSIRIATRIFKFIFSLLDLDLVNYFDLKKIFKELDYPTYKRCIGMIQQFLVMK